MFRLIRFRRGLVNSSGVVQSQCLRCHKNVAWSVRLDVLRIAERAHDCKHSNNAETEKIFRLPLSA